MGQSRNENILENILGASNPLGAPQSREEALLMQLLEKLDVTVLKWLGVTTTELTDGSTTNPITIDGESVTATAGDSVSYGSKEFSLSKSGVWQEWGDLSNAMTKTNPTGTGSFSLNRASGISIGNYSSTLGHNCVANGTSSHAEGDSSTAYGDCSHAEGDHTMAYGNQSHAEGIMSHARGDNSHAEGKGTVASGNNSHAEGEDTEASGACSHAEGKHTIANHCSQHVFGEYNIEDNSDEAPNHRGTYAEIVGNGTANNARSNARTLDWSGNETIAGDLIFNGNTSLTSSLGKILTGTLTAGQTSLTISDSSIAAGVIIDILTDVYDVKPTNVVVTTGSITLTFVAQGVDVAVKVKVM